jgi:hypothetical protein
MNTMGSEDLLYLEHDEDRHGNPRVYVRRNGKRIRIREGRGSPAFYADAVDALGARATNPSRKATASHPPGSLARKRFIDFSLSRVLSSDPLPDHAPVPSTLDDDWHKTVEVEFLPHPRLSPTQRSTIAREYGMQQGLSIVTVRRPMLFYLLDGCP